MPLLTRKSLLTFAPEATYNTAPSTGYIALEVLRDPDVAPLVADRAARETVRPWLGADRQRLINRRVTASFDCYMAGSGTAGTAPAFGGLLLSCFMSEAIVANTSTTYTLAHSGVSGSSTIRWHTDGIRHQITGARGNLTMSMAAGEYGLFKFEMQGIYSQPTEVSLPSATFTNQAAPVEISASATTGVSINSVARCMSEFELNIGNELVYENLAGCSEQIEINSRNPEGRIQVESTMLTGTGSQNVYALAEGSALVPIGWTHSGGAGSIITMSLPNCDINEPSLTDRNGKQFMDIPFAPIATSATSELSLVFT
jgi:hypothetical protein